MTHPNTLRVLRVLRRLADADVTEVYAGALMSALQRDGWYPANYSYGHVALNRLLARGLVSNRWERDGEREWGRGGRRHYFRLTTAGRALLLESEAPTPAPSR